MDTKRGMLFLLRDYLQFMVCVLFLFDTSRTNTCVASSFQSHRRNPKRFSAPYIGALSRVGLNDFCIVCSALHKGHKDICL